VDIFFFQLAIIFLPGLVWERIVTRYGLKRAPTQFEIVLRTFTFGLTAYALTFAIFASLGRDFIIPEMRRDATFIADRQLVLQFATAFGVALVGAIIWLYAFTYRWLGRLLRKIKATKRFGDEDVWDYLLNSADPRVEYAYVRDFENEQVLSGWIIGYSETDKVRELLLRDVEVFDLSGNHLYEMPLIYIGRPASAINLEFPASTNGSRNATRTEQAGSPETASSG
jgi:hypothetical protein